jgi:DNA-binding MarR family transcriptional regulator
MQDNSGEILLKFSRICFRIYLISRKNFNLTAGELFCLITLFTEKPRSIKELNKKTGIRSTTVSKHLNSLEKRLLIRRELDGTDKRIEKVFLTPEGQEFTGMLISFYNNKFSQISNFASDEQRVLILEFLNQLSLEAEKLPELHSDILTI